MWKITFVSLTERYMAFIKLQRVHKLLPSHKMGLTYSDAHIMLLI